MRSHAGRNKLAVTAVTMAAGALGVATLLRGPTPEPAAGSSHSEAPLIGQDPP
jgi:hypothetical protein